MNEDDLALATLLEIREKEAPDLDEALIMTCYAIQKKHQFDDSRGASAQAMDRLIEQALGPMDESRSA
jgi:hypothetical protein